MMLIVPCKRWSGLEQQHAQDKNNEPPLEPKPIRKQHTVNICIIVIWRGKWIDECLEEAMDAINSVTTSFKHASRH
jgi:hypothetical protein